MFVVVQTTRFLFAVYEFNDCDNGHCTLFMAVLWLDFGDENSVKFTQNLMKVDAGMRCRRLDLLPTESRELQMLLDVACSI